MDTTTINRKVNNKEISKFINEYQGVIDNNTSNYLSINYPHDSNAVVAGFRSYACYDNTSITIGKLNGEQIFNYYYNHLRSMNDIYAVLDEVLACEIKPLNLNFIISGAFEEVFWNTKTDNRPIIIEPRDDLELVKEYMNAALI